MPKLPTIIGCFHTLVGVEKWEMSEGGEVSLQSNRPRDQRHEKPGWYERQVALRTTSGGAGSAAFLSFRVPGLSNPF